MKRTIFITIAAAGLAFTAAPSYAQSSYGGGSTGGSFGNSTIDSVQRDAERAQRRAERKARKAEKKRLKAEAKRAELAKSAALTETQIAAPSSAVDANTLSSASSTKSSESYSSSTSEATFKNENVLVAGTESLLPVNCPAGTDPQADGTCMLK